MANIPNVQAIRETIDKLYDEKDKVPEYSTFGDHNWAIIDGQIEALLWVLGEGDPLVD